MKRATQPSPGVGTGGRRVGLICQTGGEPGQGAQRVAPHEPGIFSLSETLFVILLAGTLVINVLPANVGLSDPFLGLVLILFVLPSALLLDTRKIVELLRLVGGPLLGLTALGLIIVLMVDGDGIDFLVIVKNTASFAYLFVGYGLLTLVRERPRMELPAFATAILGAALAVTALMDQGPSRASAWFSNPNHTASWLAAATLTLLILDYPRARALRFPVIALLLLGLIATESYGAFVALFVGAVVIYTSRRWKSLSSQVVAIAATLAISLVALPFLGTLGSGDRLDRSESGRRELWEIAISMGFSKPFGSGPTGLAEANAAIGLPQEAHNDFLDFFVGFGFAGLMLWLVAIAGLFRFSTLAQPMIAFLATSGITHSVVNYRHIWLFVALVYAVEYWHPGSVSTSSQGPRRTSPKEQNSVKGSGGSVAPEFCGTTPAADGRLLGPV